MPKAKTTKKLSTKKPSKKNVKSPVKTKLKGIIKPPTQSLYSIAPGDGPASGKEVQFLTTEVEMHLSGEFDFEDNSDFDDFDFERTMVETEVKPEDSDIEKEEDELYKVEEEYISEESELKERFGSEESLEKDKFTSPAKFRVVVSPKKKDFFKTFGRLPSMHKIKLDPSDLEEPGTKMLHDTGLQQAEEETPVEEISSGTVELSTESSEFEYEIFTTEDEDQDMEGEIEGRKNEPRDLFEQFMNLSGPTDFSIDADAFCKFAQLTEMELVEKDTASFLEQLIEWVVEMKDYVDPNDELRSKLDKVKLFKGLIRGLESLVLEKKANDLLHKKAIEYYKRRKNFGAITPDETGNMEFRIETFDRVTKQLNRLLGEESSLLEKDNEKVNVVYEKLQVEQENLRLEIAELENLMRSTFEDRNERFRSFVDKEISGMAALRGKISKVRNNCLLRQNQLNLIKTEMEAIDNLGDNLTLSDYQNLFNQVDIIKRKYEERIEELFRMHERFLKCTAISAHMREKKMMLFNTVSCQKEILEEAVKMKLDLHSYVHEMRLRHVKSQKEIWIKSADCGLVDKPALCLDYDLTLEQNLKLKEKVDSLKAQFDKIMKKIEICEEKAK